METRIEHITYQRSGRYCIYGNPETAKTIVFALHGYGQLATFFIRKFHFFDPNEYLIVCPEGPHRFYQEGTNGRVGASWMTKEDRLTDIEDYIAFLDTLYTSLDASKNFQKKFLLGFSQGGATASRWIAYGKAAFDEFILWAAVFPPDMEADVKQNFKPSKNHLVIGNEDPYSTIVQAKIYQENLKNEGMNFEFHTFAGKHNLDQPLLLKLIK